MNYAKKVKEILDRKLNMGDEYSELLDLYALLVFVKGENCTSEDIHNAWSIWQDKIDSNYRSLVPYELLSKKVQDLDLIYKIAVRETAEEITGVDKTLK